MRTTFRGTDLTPYERLCAAVPDLDPFSGAIGPLPAVVDGRRRFCQFAVASRSAETERSVAYAPRAALRAPLSQASPASRPDPHETDQPFIEDVDTHPGWRARLFVVSVGPSPLHLLQTPSRYVWLQNMPPAPHERRVPRRAGDAAPSK
uniref:Uncharacterized protein n=1 Tax=Mycena chlorophos TaxID=658473 RepID=A0ABQ0LPG3_MYCCL|nr:predicted protein [Mycena chlorophos]